jgi:hypothetical protein
MVLMEVGWDARDGWYRLSTARLPVDIWGAVAAAALLL